MVKRILAKSYLFIILLALYFPIMIIVIYSFSNSSVFKFSEGFSFGAYQSIVTSTNTPKLMSALKNTFLIASISSVAATIIGTFAAVGIFSLSRRMRTLVENANQLPIVNSEIVAAVSLMVFFVTLNFIKNVYLRLIIGHVSFCIPYVVLSIMPKLIQMDQNIYEAALDLGASPLKALYKVLLPMLVPGIVSGFVLSFTLSLDDFIMTQINKGGGMNTLSTYIYEDARVKGLEPFWFAVFTIIFVAVIGILLLINLYNARNTKKEGVK